MLEKDHVEWIWNIKQSDQVDLSIHIIWSRY